MCKVSDFTEVHKGEKIMQQVANLAKLVKQMQKIIKMGHQMADNMQQCRIHGHRSSWRVCRDSEKYTNQAARHKQRWKWPPVNAKKEIVTDRQTDARD